MRVVVIVSMDRSDLFFANRLLDERAIAGVVLENQSAANTDVQSRAGRLFEKPLQLPGRILRGLLRRWNEKYAIYNLPANRTDFGEEGFRLVGHDDVPVFETRPGQSVNAPEVVAWLRELEPDAIAVCGASILNDVVLSIPKRGVLNLHGGLSQIYRGLFTTDWAIHDARPECIGATVHYVSPGIDDGDIVYQGQPELAETDNPSNCYEKIVKLGVHMMLRALDDIETGQAKGTQVPVLGKLCLGSMATAGMRKRTWSQYKKGVIGDFVRAKTAGKAQMPELINAYPGDEGAECSTSG